MTDPKFTDEEIIEGLERLSKGKSCDTCKITAVPYPVCKVVCKTFITKSALELINRQKAEIEALIDGQETLQKYFEKQSQKVCAIGDKLYIIVPDETAPGGYDIEINQVTEVGERFVFFSEFFPPRDDVGKQIAISDIGKDVFLDEEEFRLELEKRRGGNVL